MDRKIIVISQRILSDIPYPVNRNKPLLILRMYPNPAQNKLVIEFANPDDNAMLVSSYDINGQVLIHDQINSRLSVLNKHHEIVCIQLIICKLRAS